MDILNQYYLFFCSLYSVYPPELVPPSANKGDKQSYQTGNPAEKYTSNRLLIPSRRKLLYGHFNIGVIDLCVAL